MLAMATEYVFYSDADIKSDELHTFFATAVGGEIDDSGTVFREGMYVTAYWEPYEERNPAIRLFGFEPRITATFRFANLADEPTRDHNAALMVASVLAFFERYGGRGVLLYNGDVAVLLRLIGEVIFSRDWDEWFEVQEVAPLLARHRADTVPQPLLQQEGGAAKNGGARHRRL
jgi:hypothetical protein